MIGLIVSIAARLFLRASSGNILRHVAAALGRETDAAVERERIAADVAKSEIEGEIEARKNAREVRLATAGFWEMRLLTVLIALPFVAHLWAVWVDTQFGLFRDRCWREAGETKCGVPAFPEPFDEWQGAILLSFFGVAGAVGVGRAVAGAVAVRRR